MAGMNEHLKRRLGAILNQLQAVHGGNAPSTATRGGEREAFVELLLRSCVPLPYRFGSGEVTDAAGNVSGQIDVVIEHPFFPSFPLLGTSQHRLYLVESVAIAIEVKSSIAQFDEAVETMRKFLALDPRADWGQKPPAYLTGGVGSGARTCFLDRSALAMVFYKGWQNEATLERHCVENEIDVVLQLDPPIFFARNFRESGQPKTARDEAALAAFLFVVSEELRALSDWSTNLFRRYVEQVPGNWRG